LNILTVITYFYPAWTYGGPAKGSYELSQKLVERGHEVTVYTTDAMDNKSRLRVEANPSYIDGIRTYYFRNLSNRLAWNHKLFISPSMIPQVKREIETFDVIHLHEYRTFQNIVVHHYAKKYGVPYVLEPHGSAPAILAKQRLKNIFDVLFGHRIMRDAAKVIAMTKREVDECKKMGVDEGRIVIIPRGHNIDGFSHLPAVGQFRDKFGINAERIVLFLGRIHRIKGIDFLVKSFAELAKEKDNTVLVIAGANAGHKPALEGLIEKLDLSSRVLFTGFLDGKDKLSALVDATMLVQTSVFESAAGSPFEAILCNTPIIVTKDTGCGDIVAEADAGYLVEYGNVSALVEAMRKIIDDPTEAQDKTQRAKQYIVENLSWQRRSERCERLYESLIERRRVN
jgi:glycosyltransferase involved in cell wall biosynthesis